MHLYQGQPCLHSDAQIQGFHAEGRFNQKLLVDHLDERALQTPAKVAIIENQRRLSYAEVVRQSENLAAALHRLGVARGDVVAAQSPNWAELPIIHFACNRIGAIFVPLSEGFRERELLHLLQISRAKLLFCPEAFRGVRHADLVAPLRSSLPALRHVVALRSAASLNFDTLAHEDAWRIEQGTPWLRSLRGTADDPSHVMVSSGTTGLPRCSLFSDNNTAVKLLQQYVQAARVAGNDVAAALAPAGTGATGYNYPILTMLLLGGTSVLLEHWNGKRLDEVLELVAHNGCTLAVAVPAQLAKLVQAQDIAAHDLSTLRVVTNSGAKLPPSVADAVERLFNCTVQVIYGTSEAGATAMTRVDDSTQQRRASVGRPLDGQEVRILGDDGLPVVPGAPGEVCWRGANKSYGFLNDPNSTRRVWDDEGFLHSGDLGRIDEQGYLHIVGRKKDMIIRGGQNVNPGAIEEALLQHPAVAEVAVVACADATLGERIAACVVVKGAVAPSLESLKARVRDHGLAAWHQPELLLLLNELPRNAGGKIDKNLLARSATAQAQQLEDQAAAP